MKRNPLLNTVCTLLFVVILYGGSVCQLSAAEEPQTNTVISAGSVWNYLDDGSDQMTAWRELSFDDSSWMNGAAQLGYGDGDEATVVSFGPDPNNKFAATYFRQYFEVEDPERVLELMLFLKRDDGAVAYINGQEVTRTNMPPGDILYSTFASAAVGGAVESTFYQTSLDTGSLVEGQNVLAVEVHQANPTSSDISFDLELIGIFEGATNARPTVSITSPVNGLTVEAPANMTIEATAADSDGSVTKVEFLVDGSKVGEDVVEPYNFNWNGVPAAVYALQAVATDNVGLIRTSSVVSLTVSSDIAPPTVQSQLPSPGTLSTLTELTISFSKTVLGVDASDLLVNGVAASGVSGTGSTYTFSFLEPLPGAVSITWAASHGIVDVFTPAHPFDGTIPGETWNYTLLDVVAPVVQSVDPTPGTTLANLNSVSVLFSEPVANVSRSKLRINGDQAASLSGSGAGPYLFGFPEPPQGRVLMEWAVGHNIQDSAGNAFSAVPWNYTLDTNNVAVVISEIMYHPSSENILEEYIELYNGGSMPVNLTGWRLSAGVQFTFPTVAIPAGGYLVVAADVATFSTIYPGVVNVVGGWTGQLSNSRERIDLDDAMSNRVDRVEYADEGDWAQRQRGLSDFGIRGWTWYKEHDGLGKSLELIGTGFSNNSGQNWAPSIPVNGTPGEANSVADANIDPMILNVQHFPTVPRSTNTVVVTAEIVDESAGGVEVFLYYRADAGSPPPFTGLEMFDNGLGADLSVGDGLYSAEIPSFGNDTVVEFYVRAEDPEGQVRTWPGPALAAPDQPGPSTQTVNALYQVDDSVYSDPQALYKMIFTEQERQILAGIPPSGARNSDAQMNATFITIDGDDANVNYLVGVRNRGHGSRGANPPNYRVNFRSDDEWKGVVAINLNSRNVIIQHFGSVVARKAGADGSATIPARLRVNNVDRASAGGNMFGMYAAVEVVNSDWADNHYPLDGGGNVYRAIRDRDESFDYQGEDPTVYQDNFFKQSNVSEDDWSDLIAMLRVLGPSGTTPFTTENIREVINVEQWLRHLAVMNLFGNAESGLNTGRNDDYYSYRGVNDPRFILMYWDLDQIFGINSLGSNSGLFTATGGGQAGVTLDRFMHWPDFEPIYYRILKELLDTTFSAAEFDALADQVLGPYASSGAISGIKNWMAARRSFVLSQLPAIPSNDLPVAILTGVPRSPTPLTSATITVSGEDITDYRVSVNGGAYGAETPVGMPIVLAGLSNGNNAVAVIGKNSADSWQAMSSATTRAWVVNTSWPTVRLSEVLALNSGSFNHFGTFPDAIELYNEGPSTVNLAGMRLSDSLGNPDKFTFPGGTSLGQGEYLVLLANDPDGTAGHHTGFGLAQKGDEVYLFDSVANGGALLDSVVFGLQLADRSIGRMSGGDWELTQLTLDSMNTPQALGNPDLLKINEWLADSVSISPDDYIELFNPNGLPVALGGLHLTDLPIGHPAQHSITALSFIDAGGFRSFIADGDANDGADHVNFRLAGEQGLIGLLDANLAVIDCVIYGQQSPDISMGRCPDGALLKVVQAAQTPGAPNACPFIPTGVTTINLIPVTKSWKYDASGTDLGTEWRETAFDDVLWPEGPALLGIELEPLPSPGIQTELVFQDPRQLTYYFRTRFTLGSTEDISRIDLTHIVDDGAVFYINGVEVGTRFGIQEGPIDYNTLANQGVNEAAENLMSFSFASANLVQGENLMAVEVHQSSAGSSDIVFGLKLDAIIITNNPALAGIVINEVLANNADLEEPDGSSPDWVELYNPSDNAVDVAGMGLSDSLADRYRYVFRTDSIVPAQGYFKIRLDGSEPASTSNTGFGLKAEGGAVYLSNRPEDGGGVAPVPYGLQAANWSIGRIPDGSANWVLTLPTFGAANLAATLGNPADLKVNEWLPVPSSGDDWFEIHNPNSQPVEMSGLHLSDKPDNLLKYTIPGLSFIGTDNRGYQRFFAENGPDANFTGFGLSNSGEDVILSDAGGLVIDARNFGALPTGVSEGRLPDGSDTVVLFPETPTPGRSNFLPVDGLFINEVLSHSDAPLVDAVEIYNATGDDINIGDWYLSDSESRLRKFLIPPNTLVPGNGYTVFYEVEFNADGSIEPFSFSSAKGDEIYLSQTAPGGDLTGFRAFAEFGPAENGVSFGRFPTSVGADFVAMSQRSFGVDNPATTNEFVMGTGLTNEYPKVGPIVISEIMYHPAITNDALEFLELRNITGVSVPLFDVNNPANTWRLRKGVDINFPMGTSIAAGANLIVVSFDPTSDLAALTDFVAAYGSDMVLVGPWSGKLDNGGESVALYKPDAPQTIPGPDFGLVPYILVDRIDYDDTAPWPPSADGNGHSLQRVSASLYGNDPVNWTAGLPNPGPGRAGNDMDGDGMPDSWEDDNGLNKNFSGDALLDADGDGINNLGEYLSGTDPRNPGSYLRIDLDLVAGGVAHLRFMAVAGKTYSIHYRNVVGTGPWVKLGDYGPAGVTQALTLMDTGASVPQRIYRLVTPATNP